MIEIFIHIFAILVPLALVLISVIMTYVSAIWAIYYEDLLFLVPCIISFGLGLYSLIEMIIAILELIEAIK